LGKDNDLGQENLILSGGLILGVRANKTSFDVHSGDILKVETNGVSWTGLFKGWMVLFDGLEFRC
jgi:hypothetical protein